MSIAYWLHDIVTRAELDGLQATGKLSLLQKDNTICLVCICSWIVRDLICSVFWRFFPQSVLWFPWLLFPFDTFWYFCCTEGWGCIITAGFRGNCGILLKYSDDVEGSWLGLKYCYATVQKVYWAKVRDDAENWKLEESRKVCYTNLMCRLHVDCFECYSK